MNGAPTGPTDFVSILKEAFPWHSQLPERCAIRLAIEEHQTDFSDVVEIVTRCTQREALIERLQNTHPQGKEGDREFDRHFWTVWTEAAGFAWAVEVARFSCPEFTDDRGKPDLKLDSATWLEAKTIERSPGERKIMDHMAEASDRGVLLFRGPDQPVGPHPTLIKKFADGLADAMKKQRARDVIVFFGLYGIGYNWPTNHRVADTVICDWAQKTSARCGARIVVCRLSKWREPFVDIANRGIANT